jgi:hypothetical protein
VLEAMRKLLGSQVDSIRYSRRLEVPSYGPSAGVCFDGSSCRRFLVGLSERGLIKHLDMHEVSMGMGNVPHSKAILRDIAISSSCHDGLRSASRPMGWGWSTRISLECVMMLIRFRKDS